LCVGFGAAAELAGKEMEFDNAHIKYLSEKFYNKIKKDIPEWRFRI
jgi:cysteine sulfinate desulfinase/cysteine desulfurase-like protein